VLFMSIGQTETRRAAARFNITEKVKINANFANAAQHFARRPSWRPENGTVRQRCLLPLR
jgi:hypothetical protein